ncbi:MAG: class I SAM-dependent methyltransferase [Gammaproteobacteria bacterium]
MGLKHSYTLIAPFYDTLIATATRGARRRSLVWLQGGAYRDVLIVGIGTGLDIPLLPQGPRYVGLDLTPAMLKRARRRAAFSRAEINLLLADADALPHPDAAFDAVIMHLILAVVPHAERALSEAARVLKPHGRLLIFDKFLHPGQKAPLRRALSPLLGQIATRTDVVFEELIARTPEFKIVVDRPALVGGWFRQIALEKQR